MKRASETRSERSERRRSVGFTPTGHRRPAANRRGFALLGTILVVSIMVAAVTMAVRGSAEGLSQTASLRQAELAHAAISEGYSQVINELQSKDIAVDLTANDYDIFTDASPDTEFVAAGPMPYPPAGHPFEGEFQIHTGLRLGQRTRAPAGEDVRNSYGVVLEVQLRAESNGIGAASDERVVIGVQVPHQQSYAK